MIFHGMFAGEIKEMAILFGLNKDLHYVRTVFLSLWLWTVIMVLNPWISE